MEKSVELFGKLIAPAHYGLIDLDKLNQQLEVFIPDLSAGPEMPSWYDERQQFDTTWWMVYWLNRDNPIIYPPKPPMGLLKQGEVPLLKISYGNYYDTKKLWWKQFLKSDRQNPDGFLIPNKKEYRLTKRNDRPIIFDTDYCFISPTKCVEWVAVKIVENRQKLKERSIKGGKTEEYYSVTQLEYLMLLAQSPVFANYCDGSPIEVRTLEV